MPGPLAGVRVVELGVWIAGPAAACILGDWGAEIVKIEPPGLGDPARSFARMLGGDLPGNPPFEMDNRNKRSAVVNLQTPDGLALALELIAAADVFLTNLRPAALLRLGLGHETLLRRHPRLIYALVTGYGLSGPEAERGAYDIAAFWARSSIAWALSRPGETPPFQRGGMGDHGVGMATAAAVSAALYSREKTGEGQLVHSSLLRHGLYTLAFDLSVALRFGVSIQGGNRKTMGNPCINCYQDRDGRWFWIVGLEGERHWPPLCRAVGHPEWLEDPRFAKPAERAKNAAVLIADLDAIFAARSREEWGAIFDAQQDLWWAPVQSVEEVLCDPQVLASGGLVEVPDGLGSSTYPATPCDFLGTPWQPRSMAPAHGQHTDEILAELGRSRDQIAALRARGAVA